MALEDGATRWLKLISGQHASSLPLDHDVLDLYRLDHGVEAFGCLQIRSFARDSLDRRREAGEQQLIGKEGRPAPLLLEGGEVALNDVSGRHRVNPPSES